MTKSEKYTQYVYNLLVHTRPMYAKAVRENDSLEKEYMARGLAHLIWDIKSGLCTGYCSKTIYESIKNALASGKSYTSVKKTLEHWNSRTGFSEYLLQRDYDKNLSYDDFLQELQKGHSYHYVTSEENILLTTKGAQDLKGHEKYRHVGIEMGRFNLKKDGVSYVSIEWVPVSIDDLILEFGA